MDYTENETEIMDLKERIAKLKEKYGEGSEKFDKYSKNEREDLREFLRKNQEFEFQALKLEKKKNGLNQQQEEALQVFTSAKKF